MLSAGYAFEGMFAAIVSARSDTVSPADDTGVSSSCFCVNFSTVRTAVVARRITLADIVFPTLGSSSKSPSPACVAIHSRTVPGSDTAVDEHTPTLIASTQHANNTAAHSCRTGSFMFGCRIKYNLCDSLKVGIIRGTVREK